MTSSSQIHHHLQFSLSVYIVVVLLSESYGSALHPEHGECVRNKGLNHTKHKHTHTQKNKTNNDKNEKGAGEKVKRRCWWKLRDYAIARRRRSREWAWSVLRESGTSSRHFLRGLCLLSSKKCISFSSFSWKSRSF